MKYCSVSGRISSVNVLHPFWLPKMWLPKMVVEEAGAANNATHRLGHAARGIEFGVDSNAITAFGLGALRSSLLEADWSTKDWKRLIGTATREAFLNSYTEKLSKVVDWLAEQVPTSPIMAMKEKLLDEAREKGAALIGGDGKADKEEKERPQTDLETKEDMRRFHHIALKRTLYDSGL
ncbi:hypothetical protein FB107DRAFT_252798 [Schizophyllum commune]